MKQNVLFSFVALSTGIMSCFFLMMAGACLHQFDDVLKKMHLLIISIQMELGKNHANLG